jgi:hypothetical protein
VGLTKLEIEERINLPIQRAVSYARDNFTLATNQNMPYALQFPADTLTIELKDIAELLRRHAG